MLSTSVRVIPITRALVAVGSMAQSDALVKFRHSRFPGSARTWGTEMMRMEQDKFARKVLEAIQRDGKVKTAILDLVCSCPNVVTEY